ncbi:DUF4280 domain-containing protein [Metasolibacillus meyeri]|uniref:DUF4280 domain-containing protein n=1 Tax=Metasolibacillus meyeri TaxID=1071052 RepID=A0AAW9NYW3_9BACL|nr:DUF4280 domain-containing protein [Metasolibacillus meyeri]MEC1180068.1 DUF4280 domain-containing protein [Metasolibacillus meyeri]
MSEEYQTKGAAQFSYVVAGATLSCSQGDQTSKLQMPVSHGVYTKNKAQMNTMDFKPNTHVQPFGQCQALTNPVVAAATAANNGVLRPMPCTPMLTMPWLNGKDDQLIEGQPALTTQSTNMCLYCGTIRVEEDGQE